MPKKCKAKYAGKCRKCKFDYYPGEDILWFGKDADDKSINEHAGPCPAEAPKPPAGFEKKPWTPRPSAPAVDPWDELFKIAFKEALKGHVDQWPLPDKTAALCGDYADKAMARRAKRGIK